MKPLHLTTRPISLNSMYRGRRFWTNEGRATKHQMQQEIASKWRIDAHRGGLALSVAFYFHDNRRRDIDSHLKCLLDSMTGLVYEDDSQIDELHVYKYVDKSNPRTELEITLH